jgi:hypothetical protein
MTFERLRPAAPGGTAFPREDASLAAVEEPPVLRMRSPDAQAPGIGS